MEPISGSIDSATQTEIVQRLVDKLKACYVFPEAAERICTRLQNYLNNGEYATITDGELFALALTMHMQEVNHDQHLWVRWHSNPLSDEKDALRHNQEWQALRRLEAGLDNYGLHKVERLPGNVGYLDLRYFHRAAWGGETVVAAMNFLSNTSALIIDLRQCTGGYPAMIALLCSYLFGEEPTHLSSIYWRDDDLTQQFWTLPYVPGKRFGDKPVYVLTSRVTFSGGEEFAAILQTRQRAVVVGDKTDGGAHPGTSYRLHPHFEAFIPIGRAFNPLTGDDLEGVGITPDILIPQEHALQAAYHLALKGILASLGTAPTGAFETLAREAQAVLQEQMSEKKMCPKCGYPNQLYKTTCKNCDEPL